MSLGSIPLVPILVDNFIKLCSISNGPRKWMVGLVSSNNSWLLNWIPSFKNKKINMSIKILNYINFKMDELRKKSSLCI